MEEEAELSAVINWYLLWLIFATVLVSKVFSSWRSLLCDRLTVWYVPEPSELTDLKTQVVEMKQQLQKINMVENFADHARLKRKITKEEEGIQHREQAHKSSMKKINTMFSAANFIVFIVLRMGVIIYNRHKPVAVVPIEMFYPISPILAFPTGQPGGIGCPLWGVACSMFIDTLSYWIALRT